MLKTIKLENASSAKANEYKVFNAIRTTPVAIIPKPISNTIIEPINATRFIVMFFSKAKSTSIQEFFFRFLMLTARSKIQIIVPSAHPIGAKTNWSSL